MIGVLEGLLRFSLRVIRSICRGQRKAALDNTGLWSWAAIGIAMISNTTFCAKDLLLCLPRCLRSTGVPVILLDNPVMLGILK